MPEVRNLRGDDGLLLTDDSPWPDLVPPLCAPRAALADAWPVVLDPAQYARAAALFLSPKVKFERPDGTVGKSPGSGTVLFAIGGRGVQALRNARSLGWLVGEHL